MLELITLGGWREFGAFRAPNTALRARAAEAAETVGLAGRLGRVIGELSVGELQRALFARLILQNAVVILVDEPFAAVDAQTMSVLLDQSRGVAIGSENRPQGVTIASDFTASA